MAQKKRPATTKTASARRSTLKARTTSTEPQPTGGPDGGGLQGDPTAPAVAPAKPSTAVGSASRDSAVGLGWAQEGQALTTAQGQPVDDTDNSLRVSSRGPTLLEDHHLREKIMHFDHERIPERVVHARGAGAHGRFELYESLEDITRAEVLTDTSTVTPVFVRFSTVAGSRGSADTARDVRGFAVKLHTTQGTWDLVGNNIPVFFIQDGIKFPDFVHAVKPEPDREIPQAQSAHDTFWDFVSLQPESTHMLMWVMSDRAIPRSYRTMEGFGVHTFRLVNAAGKSSLVKFHWKPAAGIHSLVWEESQKLGGIDPDFHRRDLWNAIESGAYPQWDLGVQVMPDTEDQTFEGIDLLDPTKIVPEELCPVRLVGRMTLDANPANFFAETEQVAFHPGHLPPGIDLTDDPLLHARLFSYLDTQITRLGGPNFAQLPINRPAAPVNDNQRDGFGQQAVHTGRAAYSPNTIGAGCPFATGDAGFVHFPQPVAGTKVRQRAQSFDDHFSQATLFWNSLSAAERDHEVGAFSFELSKVGDPAIVARMMANLADVDADLAAGIALHLGLTAPVGDPFVDVGASPALSLAPVESGPIEGRVVGVLVTDGVDVTGVTALRKSLDTAGAALHVIAPHGGSVKGKAKSSLTVDATVFNADSVVYDALVVADGSGPLDAKSVTMLQEAYRHHKTLAAWGSGVDALTAAGLDIDAPGVVTGERPLKSFNAAIVATLGWHRHWERVDGPSLP
ncbi:MAG: catalase [Acidimicrobiia bacterium]|nr:catalase [Acidimicrobiia bacterium]